ncbi:hypothetical protein NL676_016241 [Syzygium grande]|nr:hypothetical protein NL676_016241 [Syzygium grande]
MGTAAAACTGLLIFASSSSSTTHFDSASKTQSVSLSSSTPSFTTDADQADDKPPKFSYSRAFPPTRWPHLKLPESLTPRSQFLVAPPPLSRSTDKPNFELVPVGESEEETRCLDMVEPLDVNEESLSQDGLGRLSRNIIRKMSKLAFQRAKDWRERGGQILHRWNTCFGSRGVRGRCVGDQPVQMTPTDFYFVVKWVGQCTWQRALESINR